MNFKKGDRVKIKDLKEFHPHLPPFIDEEMLDLSGKEATVEGTLGPYVQLEGYEYNFDTEWLELLEPKSDGKIKSTATNRRVKAPAMPAETWQPDVETLDKDSIMDNIRRTCKGR